MLGTTSPSDSIVKLLAFWTLLAHNFRPRREGKGRGKGGREEAREGGREEEIHNMHKWAHILATHSASLISDHHLTQTWNRLAGTRLSSSVCSV